MPRPISTSLVALAVVGFALAACGGSSSKSASDCTAHPGKAVTVQIGNFTFSPTPVKVRVCDAVVWKNVHDQAHTSTGNGDKSWSTGNIAPGTSAAPIRFDKAGTLTYMCALHPFMHGVVEVS